MWHRRRSERARAGTGARLSLAEAERELAEQREKCALEEPLLEKLRHIRDRNHLAEAVTAALAQRRREG